jgi:hypothetical protein
MFPRISLSIEYGLSFSIVNVFLCKKSFRLSSNVNQTHYYYMVNFEWLYDRKRQTDIWRRFSSSFLSRSLSLMILINSIDGKIGEEKEREHRFVINCGYISQTTINVLERLYRLSKIMTYSMKHWCLYLNEWMSNATGHYICQQENK